MLTWNLVFRPSCPSPPSTVLHRTTSDCTLFERKHVKHQQQTNVKKLLTKSQRTKPHVHNTPLPNRRHGHRTSCDVASTSTETTFAQLLLIVTCLVTQDFAGEPIVLVAPTSRQQLVRSPSAKSCKDATAFTLRSCNTYSNTS